MSQLNSYQITWGVLIPITGKATKKDLSIIRKVAPSFSLFGQTKEFAGHFPTKEKALNACGNINGLSKPYKLIFITDKQFGLSNTTQSLIQIATKKQLIEINIVL